MLWKRKKKPKYEVYTYTTWIKRTLVQLKEDIIVFEDGDKVRCIRESLFPLEDNIDGTTPFSAYGQKIYNDIYKEEGISSH